MKRLILSLLLLCTPAFAATNWYVDPAASGADNGTSWTDAWTSISSISSSVSPGDTVYISGGSTSQTYNVSGWTPISGDASGVITYRVGQDAGHNGTVIFNGGTNWLSGSFQYVTISGDMNGDGLYHMKVQNYSDFVWLASSGTVSHVTLRRIWFPSMVAGIRFAGATTTAVDFDALKLEKVYYGSNGWADDVIYGLMGNAFDTNSVHDCYISIQANNGDSAWGDDGLKWPSGLDFYDNHVKVNLTSSYPDGGGAQHSDVFQMGGSYMKIYDNIFEDVGESIAYQDNFDTVDSIHGIYIYNNLFVNSHAPGSDVARGIDIQPEGSGVGTTFTDVIIANNDFVDWTTGVFLVRFDQITSCTNCVIENNIAYNSPLGYSVGSVPVTISNNVSSSVNFVSYTEFSSGTNDLHLTSDNSSVIGQGLNLSTYFTTDKDGNARASSGAWDIGAYVYGGTPPPSGTALQFYGNVLHGGAPIAVGP